MATKQEAVKLKKGEAVKFNSRMTANWRGKGKFVRYEDSGRGKWAIVDSEHHGREIALRLSQVKTAGAAAPKAEKATPAAETKPKRVRPSRSKVPAAAQPYQVNSSDGAAT